MTPNGVLGRREQPRGTGYTAGPALDTAAESPGVNVEAVGKAALGVVQYFRPSDGWAALGLLVINLLIVIYSVEQANWVDTPNLGLVLLLAMVTGLFLARVPFWGILVLPIGLAAGLLVTVWRLTSHVSRTVHVDNADQLWERLSLWVEAARTGSISIDAVPFAFGLVVATWLCGYLATWVFVRYRNFWGVFVLGGAGIMSNLTYLPPNASVHIGLFLFTAFLLIARVQSVRRRREWEERHVTYDGHLSALSLSDSFIIALAVLLVAFFLPVGSKYGPANNAYEYFRTPMQSWEDDFNRLFAGLPARKPLGYRIWGDVMAFQGTIHPTQTQVLFVESQVPMYWKARSYGTYTPKGWVSDGTVLKPNDWTPSVSVPQPYLGRFDITYQVMPNYDSRTLFAGDQVIGIDRNVRLETYDSPTYTLDMQGPGNGRAMSPKLAEAADTLRQTLALGGDSVSNSSLAARLPDDFRLVEAERNRGGISRIVLAEVLPSRPDVLSVQSTGREIKARDSYEITSSVSTATPDQLRRAGTDYPTHIVQKYTQLHDELPERVRDLALQLTASAETPYDKAKAIEFYLSGFPYTLEVEPPPFNADGVDHFLFTLGEGYSEYFGSAMTVMLRSIGIPARFVTGYTTGDKVVDRDLYVVTDSHSHGWIEAYMPNYGWIPFEPTPGRSIPVAVPPPPLVAEVGDASGTQEFDDEDCIEEIEECDEELLDATPGEIDTVPLPWGGQLATAFLWAAGGVAGAGVLGLLAWLAWRRYMTVSEDPRVVFRRMATLGTLASVGPASHQTPFQYRLRLSDLLPDHRQPVSVIVDHYVRSIYGRKELDEIQRQELTQAWLDLRMPLLLRILRPRSI